MKSDTAQVKVGSKGATITVRLSTSQRTIIDELGVLTGQDKTALVSEAISAYLYPLYKRLKGERGSNV